MWIDGLKLYDKKIGINWKWQSMDGAITKAPLGGKKYRTKSNRHKK
jgi:putative transposase